MSYEYEDEISDDEFQQYIEDETEKDSKGSNTYVQINYAGLKTNEQRIIRMLGGPVDSKKSNATARVVQYASIYGDDNKKFDCYLPIKGSAEAKDHLLWQIIDTVNSVTWINKKKHFVHETTHPEIFNKINKNGIPDGDKRKLFDRGWQGQQILLANVIDREDYQWHVDNKHSKILAKEVTPNATQPGNFWVKKLPSYGFLQKVNSNIIPVYGSWEKYDLAIEATGKKDEAYKVLNATKFLSADMPELHKNKREFVSLINHLTDEEKSWERYDLVAKFPITKYSKIYNRLKHTLDKIDYELGTNFKKRLKLLVDEESAQESKESTQTVTPQVNSIQVDSTQVDSTQTVAKTRASTPQTVIAEDFDKTQLGGWESLTDLEKSMIKSVKIVDGKPQIQFIDLNTKQEIPFENLVLCPDCGWPSPEEFTHCPYCGKAF